MDFNFSQFTRFLARTANDAVVNQTGVDVLGKYYDVRSEASYAGLNIDPEQMLHRNNGDKTIPPRPTPKEKLCKNVKELTKLRDKVAKIPLGGAVVLAHALLNYMNPDTRSEGEKMLVLAVSETLLVKGNTYKGYALNEELAEALQSAANEEHFKNALSSLVIGTSSQQMYAFDAKKVSFLEDIASEQGDDTDDGEFTIYFWSTGSKDSPRRINLVVNAKGLWKAREFQELFGDVEAVPITSTAADDL